MQYETKEQRKSIYEDMLVDLVLESQDNTDAFLCFCIRRVIRAKRDIFATILNYPDISQFPELWAQRPTVLFHDREETMEWWWDAKDFSSRFTALENAIKLCDETI